MKIQYEIIPEDGIDCLRDLCNDLMAYQKSVAKIRPELFDGMRYETRLVPSVRGAKANRIIAAKDGDAIVGYVYSNVSAKETYDSAFANFFEMDSVQAPDVGCLSQFFLREGYRGAGLGSALFRKSMEWLGQFDEIKDIFIFVSNGNDSALKFYLGKGFKLSHQILGGFITVLRNT